NLIQDVPTRWNSTFLMLERTKEQVDAINETLFDRRLNRKYENLNLDLAEKEMLNEAVFILQPFYDATVELSGSKYSTLSIVIPVFQGLINLLETEMSDSGFSVALNKVLKHNTIGYMSKTKLFVKFLEAKKKEYVNIAKNKIRSIADDFPENLKQNLKLNESNTVTRLTQIDQSVMETNSKNRLQLFDFNKDFEAKKTFVKLSHLDKELYRYNLEPSKNSDPLIFWKANKENFPILFQIFIRIFSIPATSVPSEQLFSAAGYSIWDRRNKIKPEIVNKVLTIYQNLP
ncbi:unnamed protein product, partial [Brachionus calyciflorus]